MDGVWLLPTKGRVGNLRRFLNAAREMGTGTPGWILVNRSEWKIAKAEYEALTPLLPLGWKFRPVQAQSYGDALRAIWREVKDLPWVGLVADDLVPCTANWDSDLIAQLQGWNAVSSNDGWQAPNRMHGATVFSGDLLRAVGWLFPPQLKHIFHDDIWETLGKETNCLSWKMDVTVRHLHEALDGIRGPTMDRNSLLWKHDEAVYRRWLEEDKDAVVERIRAMQSRYGVKRLTMDFTGVNLMVGTPTHDGRYDSAYMAALFNTFAALKQSGVPCRLAEEKYTADIALARSKIFSAFLRSDCTHLLMIDADMGWEMDAIIRLFCAKKEFVAIAGPKKRYPLSFAANYTDDNGNPITMTFDPESGTMECGEVGMAFCLITRECAQRIAQAYPELHYIGVTGEMEVGAFSTIIHNQRWYSEDFAFCKRWRNIGGRVFIVPDIALSHVGNHTFRGAFAAQAIERQSIMAEAAD